ncbi:hypothetical protein [Micromonospora sp. NBC_01638]|nr:hypothetical protein OG811_25245 [Micromonospora sp. NBC_01638]
MPEWAGRGGRQRRAFVVGGALFAIAVVMHARTPAPRPATAGDTHAR